MNYKCPCCSAPLRYDGATGQLACDSCGNVFPLNTVQQAEEVAAATADQDIQWEASDGAWRPEEAEQLRTYSCPSCGAEIVVDATTAATECVYCGNASIMPGALSGSFRPDAVLPFVKTKEDAVKAYADLIKDKKLLPRAFASKKHMDKITGVYVPFWLFQCRADCDLSFRAERVHTHTEGRDQVTDIEHFMVMRGGTLDFDGVPVDGSTKFDDTLMESIEPFDYGKMQEFDAAYLPGYQAERYDVDAEAAQARANERIRTSTVEAFASTVQGYSAVTPQSVNVRLQHGQVTNVLAPVWMLNTKWEGKTYTFAMNGQTGRLVGDLPTDSGAAWKYRLRLFLGPLVGVVGIALILSLLGVI